MDTKYDITKAPYIYTKTFNVVSFSFRVINLVPFSSVTINITFFDEKGTFISGNNITLSGKEYDGWGSDDNYLVNYINANIDTLVV